MQIDVIGGSQSQKRRAASMVRFCASELFPKMKRMDITVRITKINDGSHGYCTPFFHSKNSDRPREFELEINRENNLRLLLETVAHEMIHVKQYARGELYYSSHREKHRWQGRWINYRISYSQQPWEKEAFKNETVLVEKWLKAKGLENRKWALQES
jgi:hypothetical protein